ncbi:MAG: hypothetical protein K2Y09_01600 [Nitrosomonas sp.]|nr:hypothetical protein [Nitrosomonas sp.]MBX9893865.1 hypothetical protein [Nitrosomonas sp.]
MRLGSHDSVLIFFATQSPLPAQPNIIEIDIQFDFSLELFESGDSCFAD